VHDACIWKLEYSGRGVTKIYVNSRVSQFLIIQATFFETRGREMSKEGADVRQVIN